MVAITKQESEVIRDRFHDAHIVRTMKQKSKRHRYYCEETSKVMRLLDELRADPNLVNDKRGDCYRH